MNRAATDRARERAATATAVEKAEPQHPVQVLLEQYTGSLHTLLPRGMDVARFKRTAWLAVRDDPKLLRCDPGSVVAGVFRAGQLGLELGGTLGHCYLVPFKNQATFILGYKGMVALAHRSERVLDVVGRVVRDGDRFEYDYGTDEFIHHRPVGDPDAPLTHVYAIARYVNGGRNLEVLTRAQVDKYRARSRASAAGAWVTDYEPMAMKTAVRRLAPFLPLTVEEARLIAPDGDERAYTLHDLGDVIDVQPIDDEDGVDPPPDGGHTDAPADALPLEG